METEADRKISAALLLERVIDDNEYLRQINARLREGINDEEPARILRLEKRNKELAAHNAKLAMELAMMIARFQPKRMEKVLRRKRKGRIDATQPDDPPRGVWIEK